MKFTCYSFIHSINIYWATTNGLLLSPVIPIGMGRCRFEGLAGATPQCLLCHNTRGHPSWVMVCLSCMDGQVTQCIQTCPAQAAAAHFIYTVQ